jgi:hypothetical protein
VVYVERCGVLGWEEAMDKESKRQSLIDALRNLTPEMEETLRRNKEEGREEADRPDFVWHFLLQSFATMGNIRGWDGLLGNRENYDRVTFEALSGLDHVERLKVLNEVLRAAKVRMPSKKAAWLNLNYEMIAEIGGPEEATRQALAQADKEAKIAFMQSFHGIGDKYARNIWMDVYHPDFRDAIAVDERIKRITQALGYSFKTYAEHERFYQEIAREAGLEGWEVDRLLFQHQGEFLAAISTGREEQATDAGDKTVYQQSDLAVHESSKEVVKGHQFSADDLIALSGLSRAFEILEKTIDAEVRDELAHFAGNQIKRTPANLMQQIRVDEGYFIYASLDKEGNFGCYVGYALRTPDGYPRLQVGLYADAGAAESKVMRAAIERVSHLEGWKLNPENTEEHEVWREMNVASLLGEKDHVGAAKGFFIESIRQLKTELTTFKKQHPEHPWEGG